MRPPSAADLLGAWEHGLRQPSFLQALALLNAAAPEQAPDALAGMSIGQRDACLLSLRESSFGPQVTGIVTCRACEEQIELDFDIQQIRAAPPGGGEVPSAPLSVSASGYEVNFRLPGTRDIALSIHQGDIKATRRALFERCVVSAHHDGSAVSPTDIPPHLVDVVEARMGEADPQADVRLALTCSECAFEWEATFDIGTFLWTELDAWARRTLFEVHLLASAYGWREPDVLALSPSRPLLYLEPVSP